MWISAHKYSFCNRQVENLLLLNVKPYPKSNICFDDSIVNVISKGSNWCLVDAYQDIKNLPEEIFQVKYHHNIWSYSRRMGEACKLLYWAGLLSEPIYEAVSVQWDLPIALTLPPQRCRPATCWWSTGTAGGPASGGSRTSPGARRWRWTRRKIVNKEKALRIWWGS